MMNGIRRDNGTISYLAYRGETTATPIVFLHGVFDSAACWNGLIGELGNDHDMFALDARAHGRTLLSDDDFTLQRLGADAASFIERLGRPVALAGHSMGGITAQQVAVTRPELVEALVLEDPPMNASISLSASF
jgi:lipase